MACLRSIWTSHSVLVSGHTILRFLYGDPTHAAMKASVARYASAKNAARKSNGINRFDGRRCILALLGVRLRTAVDKSFIPDSHLSVSDGTGSCDIRTSAISRADEDV